MRADFTELPISLDDAKALRGGYRVRIDVSESFGNTTYILCPAGVSNEGDWYPGEIRNRVIQLLLAAGIGAAIALLICLGIYR